MFALANVVKKFRVTFDSAKENAFLVHMKNGTIKFEHEAIGPPSDTGRDKAARAIANLALRCPVIIAFVPDDDPDCV